MGAVLLVMGVESSNGAPISFLSLSGDDGREEKLRSLLRSDALISDVENERSESESKYEECMFRLS